MLLSEKTIYFSDDVLNYQKKRVVSFFVLPQCSFFSGSIVLFLRMKSDYEDEGEDEDEDDSGASKFTVSDLEDPGTDSEKSRESGSDGRKTDDDEEKCPEEPPDDDFVFDVSEDECEVSDATQSLTIKRFVKKDGLYFCELEKDERVVVLTSEITVSEGAQLRVVKDSGIETKNRKGRYWIGPKIFKPKIESPKRKKRRIF